MMEMIGRHKSGKHIRAFGAQEGAYVNMDSAMDEDDEKKLNRHNSTFSLLKQKVAALKHLCVQHRDTIVLLLKLLVAAGWAAVVIAACVLNFHRAIGLLVISSLVLFFLIWDWTMARYGDRIWEGLLPVRDLASKQWIRLRWLICACVLVGLVCWLVLDTAKRGERQLVSFFGLLLLIFLMMLFSKHPFCWSWQPLFCGLGLQFIFGLLVLRTSFGLKALEWLGYYIEVFIAHTDVGSRFIFGDNYEDHFFIFKVMPILIFMSSFISILYHLGFMQWLIYKMGFIMQVTMGTSSVESMAAAANIFLGQIETPILIRPYISGLTLSEIHALMTGGFASIAGTLLAVFISFGVEASHLMTASLMSAPASLTVSKLFWPETETPSTKSSPDVKVKQESTNILEAASQGAIFAVSLVGNVVVNLLSFTALLAFLDGVVSWLGAMFDYPQLSFSLMFSYVLMPLAFIMGVSWEDSFVVAELVGLKTFLNEIVAYQKLSLLMKRRKAGGPEYVNNVKQYISVHSETIATYALCGFSNFASLGMSIAALISMAPERQSDISSCGVRSLIAGCVSCFMTACVAGTLYIPKLECPNYLSITLNSTNVTVATELLTCCTQLYNSVTVHEPWNFTLKEFTESSLQACCALTPSSSHFNCSWLL
ncbi:solute carrier family 28 member 3-like isoform X1 [Syngnathus acus]|uniref:solute carrier family 28 member 3-like isoform X1 n=1 Tax=Syngnathus acus TaxID=161584 RepID=UPI00188649A7|nr:solute carrier family 28 member 3-like isoform X1 [Syngnathus acus]